MLAQAYGQGKVIVRVAAALNFDTKNTETTTYNADTFSAGLVACPQDGHDLSALLRAADRRLQIAKRAGSNRVIARDV